MSNRNISKIYSICFYVSGRNYCQNKAYTIRAINSTVRILIIPFLKAKNGFFMELFS